MSKKNEFQKIYPLSPMQTRMLFHYLRDPESNVAFEQSEMQITGQLDITLFEQSFNLLLQRYDILRTNIVYQKIKVPRQVVFKEKKEKVLFEDISAMSEEDKRSYMKEMKAKDMSRGFDLTKDTLIRVSVFKVAENSFYLIWSHHHIIMDGWCLKIIFQDFLQIYLALKEGRPVNLNRVYPYSSYIEWLEKQDQEEAKNYWEKYLKDYQVQALPYSSRGELETGAYLRHSNPFRLEKELAKGLEKFAQANTVTVNTVIQAIWGLLLQQYNHTNDVIFGAVVSGRPPQIEGIEHMLGMFINTIPVRVRCEKEDTFLDLLKHLQEETVISSEYDYYPLSEIQFLTSFKGELINNIIIYENYPVDDKALNTTSQNIGFEVKLLESFSQTNYAFNLFVTPGEYLDFNLVIDGNYYTVEDLHRIQTHLDTMIRRVIQNPEVRISELDILTSEEKEVSRQNIERRLQPKDLRQNPNYQYVAPTNHIQQKMVYIWEEVLGVQGVGVNHNFFDIGGNSVNTLQVIKLMNEEFEVNISASELFLSPTIEELAANIYKDSDINQLEYVVRLNKLNAERKNVFLVHGPDGSGYLYKELAKYLQGECNLYGIQAKGLFNPDDMVDSVDEMTSEYLKEIRMIQPNGPYVLGGYCYGTRLLYEMVRRLEEEGEIVEKMISIDEFAFFTENLSKLLKMRGKVVKSVMGIRKIFTHDATLPAVSNWLNKKIQPETVFIPKEERTIKEHIAHLCLREYPLRDIVKAPVYVIKAEESKDPRYSKELWSFMTYGSVEMFEIPGDHFNIFAEPYVQGLADAMKKVLDA